MSRTKTKVPDETILTGKLEQTTVLAWNNPENTDGPRTLTVTVDGDKTRIDTDTRNAPFFLSLLADGAGSRNRTPAGTGAMRAADSMAEQTENLAVRIWEHIKSDKTTVGVTLTNSTLCPSYGEEVARVKPVKPRNWRRYSVRAGRVDEGYLIYDSEAKDAVASRKTQQEATQEASRLNGEPLPSRNGYFLLKDAWDYDDLAASYPVFYQGTPESYPCFVTVVPAKHDEEKYDFLYPDDLTALASFLEAPTAKEGDRTECQ